MRFSLRVCIQITGCPSRRASAATTTASGAGSNLPPNPPPTCGARRARATGRCRGSRRRHRARVCTRWVEAHRTTPSPSGIARRRRAPSARPRHAGSRTDRARRGRPRRSPRPRLRSCSSQASGAVSSPSSTTGSGSTSTTTSSAASAASAAVSATTTASGSPTNRTSPSARGGRVNVASSIGCPRNGASPRSAAVSTATTPGAERAELVSTARRRPCATDERTNAAWSRGPERSARYRPCPRSSGPSSTRRVTGRCSEPPPGLPSSRADLDDARRDDA